MADPSNVFVISSDFCHWGQRFRYQHYDEKCGDIWESIKVGRSGDDVSHVEYLDFGFGVWVFHK